MPNNPFIQQIEAGMPDMYSMYMDLVTPSEVPIEFHPFTFMTLMSALIGDRAYFIEGMDRVYPNVWTLMVGESSLSRKSSAQRPAIKLLNQVKGVNIFPSSGSPEGLIDEIIELKGIGIFTHSELGALLGALKQNYMSGFAEVLCVLYDPLTPSALRRKLVGKDTHDLDHIAVSWLACVTQSSLSQHLTVTDNRVASGFLPRWNIVFGSSAPHLISFRPRKEKSASNKIVKAMTAMLLPLKAKNRELIFEPDAQAIFHEWYVRERKLIDSRTIDDITGAFWTRTFEVVKKYATMHALMHGSDPIVRARSMEWAMLVGKYFLQSAYRLVHSEMSANRDESERQQIVKAVRKRAEKGKQTYRRYLMQMTKIGARQFDEHMRTLIERGCIYIVAPKVDFNGPTYDISPSVPEDDDGDSKKAEVSDSA